MKGEQRGNSADILEDVPEENILQQHLKEWKVPNEELAAFPNIDYYTYNYCPHEEFRQYLDDIIFTQNTAQNTRAIFFSCIFSELYLYFYPGTLDANQISNYSEIFKLLRNQISKQEITIDIIKLNQDITSIFDGMRAYKESHVNEILIQKIQRKINIINNIVIENKIIKGDYEFAQEIIDSAPFLETFPPAIIIAIQSATMNEDKNHDSHDFIISLCSKINPESFPKSKFEQDINGFKIQNNITSLPVADQALARINEVMSQCHYI